MSYRKLMVDNPTCSRRFHVAFDDDDAKATHVELRCPFCDVVVFAEDDHPPVKLIRQENLTKTTALSERLIEECEFKDTFGEKSIPHA